MAPSPQCSALNAAINRQGVTYAQLAQRVGVSEQRVIDVVTGKDVATTTEFNALASALGITNAPHDAAHATK
ncbi:hypothetical protein BC834DRAFT_969404 [Gloeopeniophorella convolvens]|nr:hypothetical protein BC834DRAFT_969404 [Gloeopeniophorella convolvens]